MRFISQCNELRELIAGLFTTKPMPRPWCAFRIDFIQIYEAIRNGADAFLSAEYTICCIFIVVFGAVVFFLVSVGQVSWVEGAFTTGAFVLGAVTSILSGYIGMKVRPITRTGDILDLEFLVPRGWGVRSSATLS